MNVIPKMTCPLVAPFTGAWIEILVSAGPISSRCSRSLHGSVD